MHGSLYISLPITSNYQRLVWSILLMAEINTKVVTIDLELVANENTKQNNGKWINRL